MSNINKNKIKKNNDMTDSDSYTSKSSSNSSSNISDSSDVDYSKNGDEFVGDVINNQYMLLYKIGWGSFSSVWLTYDILDDKFYALKIQTPDDYDEGIKELKIYDMISKICKNNKEVDTLMTLKHNFIFEKNDDKYVCMLMDLMAGSLYDVIKTDKYSNGLPTESVIKVEEQ